MARHVGVRIGHTPATAGGWPDGTGVAGTVKTLRLLVMLTERAWGGAEKYVRSFAEQARRRGHEVDFLVPEVGVLGERFRDVGAETFRGGVPFGRARGLGSLLPEDPRTRRAVERCLRDAAGRYDVLVLQSLREQIRYSAAAREAGLRVVWWLHSPVTYRLHRLAGVRGRLGRASRHAERVITVSHVLGRALEGYGVAPRRVSVIPVAVDVGPWEFEPPEGAPDPPVVGYVGRLVREKGVRDLVRAAASLRERGLGVELRLVGEGRDRPHLEKMAARAGIAEHVCFPGFVDDVRAEYLRMHVFVNPTVDDREGFPTNNLEAMAYGRPVISAAMPQTEEQITDGQDGLLVPGGDPDALATAVRRLLDDPALRERIARCGYDRVRGELTWERVADRVLEAIGTGAEAPSDPGPG